MDSVSTSMDNKSIVARDLQSELKELQRRHLEITARNILYAKLNAEELKSIKMLKQNYARLEAFWASRRSGDFIEVVYHAASSDSHTR